MRWLATGVLAVTLLTAGLTGQSDSGTFVIRNVRVFDGETVAERQTVVIGEGRITAVGSAVSVPPGALEIPGTGRTLLPGLMDAHIHLPIFSLTTTAALQQSLAFGVTTTVVMAAAPSQFASRLKEIEAADAPDLAALLSAGTAATAPGGPSNTDGWPRVPDADCAWRGRPHSSPHESRRAPTSSKSSTTIRTRRTGARCRR
jgi:hypothetical protein